MAALEVSLFGGFRVHVGGEPLPPIPSRAGRLLFAYLVVNRHRSHPRESLATSLWPDLPESRARRRLSHTLWQVQDSLSELAPGTTYLEATNETIGFDATAPYWLDVEEFERRLDDIGTEASDHPLGRLTDIDALRECVELYRGDFLAGYYEDWVVAEQERLQQRYVTALAQLVGVAKGVGDYEEALTYARRLSHQDPLREDAHREVMRLCVLLGRTGEALRQYERCRSVLSEELGAEPAAATTELYARIARQRGVSGPPGTPLGTPEQIAGSSLPLIGRERERRTLVDRLEEVLGGRGGVVLVEGEPGVGKTRLVRQCAEDANWRGFGVLWAPCRDAAARRPYEPLAESIESGLSPVRAEQLAHRLGEIWLREAARLVPCLTQVIAPARATPALHGSEGADRMRAAVTRLLVELGRIAPTLLVVEDVHWADHETLDALGILASEVRDTQLLMALTYRDQEARDRPEVWDALRLVDRDGQPDRLSLEALTSFGTAELVRSSLQTRNLARDFVTRLQRETGGNPLFVLETLRALREQDRLDEVGNGTPEAPDELPVSGGLHGLIGQRLESLSEPARGVLSVAAVLGQEVELDVLMEACDQTRGAVADAVDELVRRGVFEDHPRCSFAHALTRRVAYASLSPTTRTSLHRRVADVLERLRPGEVEALTHHCQHGDVPSRLWRHARTAAARALEIHGYASSVEYFRIATDALERVPATVDDRFGLLAEHEAALDVLGRRDEQARILERMAELASGDPKREADVLRRQALVLAHTDRFDAAEATAREARSAAEASGDADILAASLHTLGEILMWAWRLDEAIPVLEQAAASAEAGSVHEAQARFVLANALRQHQRYADAERQLERARSVYVERDDQRGEAQALGTLAAVHMETGASERSEQEFGEAIDLARRIGFAYAEGVNLVNRGNLSYLLGRTGLALRCHAEAAEVFRGLGNRRGEAMARLNAASVRHRVLGEDERAREDAERACAYFREVGNRASEAHCLETIASIARRRGNRDVARATLEAALAAVESTGERWAMVQLHRSQAELDLDDGNPQAAREHLHVALALCDELGTDEFRSGILALEGVALVRLGHVSAAVEWTGAAVTALVGATERPYVVHFHHHLTLVAAGHDRAARAALEAAHGGLQDTLADLTEQERALALQVPEHRAIHDAWEAIQPRTETLRVARAHAPTGRPLRAEELVDIVLTVAQADDPHADEQALRRSRLLEFLEQVSAQGGAPTIADLARVLRVSPATVRRDLHALRSAGHDVTTRGSRATG